MKLELQHLSKRYRERYAVRDVNVTLTPGVYGLLGANGAGKTRSEERRVGKEC